MKVIQINAVNKYGSTGRMTSEFDKFLKEHRHNSFVFYSEGISAYGDYKIGSKFEKKIHAFMSRLTGLQAYFSRIGTKKLIKQISIINPDIVHLGNLHGNYINLRILFKYLAENNIATVLTLHDCWFYTGKCTHYTTSNCLKWVMGCNNCPRLKLDNPSWIFDRTNKMWRDKKKYLNNIPKLGVIGVSDWITNEAKKSFLKNAFIKTIYNWIDLDSFYPRDIDVLIAKYGLKDKFIILGVASGWSNTKGLDKFINLSNCLDDNHRVVLVGRMSSKLETGKKIIKIPRTNNINELAELYSIADVFVNLTEENSFGMVTAEAIACGTPAIVLNSTANPEIIGENCGLVIKNSTTAEIISAIKTIEGNGKSYYSEKCVKYAKEKFDIKKSLQDYIDFYKEILKK